MKLIFVFILSGISLFGGYNLDSLLTAIQTLPDTVQIRILNETCWNNRSNNTVAAMAAGEKALEISRRIANKALEARTLNLLGVVNRSYGNNDKSLFYLSEALKIATESNNRIEIAYSENNIGGSFRMKGYFTLAFQHVSTALRIFESLKDSAGISYAIINIGFIYQGQRNSAKALEYFRQTYEIRKNLRDSVGMLIALSEIAQTQKDLGFFQIAQQNFEFILEKSILRRDPSSEINANVGLGEIAIAKNDFAKAFAYLSLAYKKTHQIGNLQTLIHTSERLGFVLASLGRFTEAESIIKNSLVLALPLNDYSLLIDSYHSLAMLYQLSGDFKQALHYANLYSNLKDSITSKDNISSVSEMEALYQNEKVKKDNAVLQKNIEIAEAQRSYSLIIAFLFIVISASLFWRYRTEKRAHAAEEDLRRSEAKYRRIFQNAYMGIFQITPESEFLNVNPAMAQLFGYFTPEDFLDKIKRFSDLPSLNSNPSFSTLLAAAQTKEWNSQEFRFQISHDIQIITLMHIRKEMKNVETIEYIEGIIENITERKLAEEQKEKYSADLKNLNATKDKFFSIISHDLRGPYQGFLGITELLAENPGDFNPDKIQKIGVELHNAAQNQYQLLNDLLNWSRLQTGDFTLQLETFALAPEIDDIANTFALTARKKNIAIENNIQPDLFITADRSMLHILFRNLISNSLKFTYPGGFIKLHCKILSAGIQISVQDNGIGIDPEDVEKLFRIDTKHTTEGIDQEQGTGLGLMLCYEIVQKHSGTLTVQSELKKGSSFIIYLPYL